MKRYAEKAGISKRIHPYFFRHQLLSCLKDKGIVDAKVQLLSQLKHRGNLWFYNINRDFPESSIVAAACCGL